MKRAELFIPYHSRGSDSKDRLNSLNDGSMGIFREEAISAQQTKWLSDVILVRPISFTVGVAFSVAVASVICLFLIFGTYTKHSTVDLLPNLVRN
ncbi:hypothetical protein Undi14_04650 [Undibacterium sp. 14-3-2]|uniref:hypothetical protein n=1 Tax=Undibacterium sp. 14-3-2 TaxID=2800129 RepID=UPI00190429BE|nr:hypothetical protein [Undibacterium sp. 14-3-2]MBK1889312.1 hypothetical protein [Undibacterium sp. 14-3-2]